MKICDKPLYGKLELLRSSLDIYLSNYQIDIAENNAEPTSDAISVMRVPQRAEARPEPLEIQVPDFLRRGKITRLDNILDEKEETFSATLLKLIDEKGLKDSEVYKKANIDRRLFSKIRGDENYMPSKKTAISFCMALQLNIEEADMLLKTAGYTLSASSRFDLIIRYLIENQEYNIQFANIVLTNYGEDTLSR